MRNIKYNTIKMHQAKFRSINQLFFLSKTFLNVSLTCLFFSLEHGQCFSNSHKNNKNAEHVIIVYNVTTQSMLMDVWNIEQIFPECSLKDAQFFIFYELSLIKKNRFNLQITFLVMRRVSLRDIRSNFPHQMYLTLQMLWYILSFFLLITLFSGVF